MCQLLGMNCNVPTDICFSFTGFRQRGGLTDHHTDGWGIVFYEGKGIRQFLDPNASAHSPIAEFVRNYPIKSKNVISHIRKATQGITHLENTHPFTREVWGQYWTFAHNGDLKEFEPSFSNERYMPVGSTDSEKAFCLLLNNLIKKFDQRPSQEEIFNEIHKFTLEICEYGVSNFLLSNGEFMVAHCSTKLASIIRKAPFNVAHLKDDELQIDFSKVTTPNDRVAVIATIPLTDNEVWTIHEAGTLLIFQEGEMSKMYKTKAGVSNSP